MPTTPKLPARIVNMLRAGATRSQIAANLGLTDEEVYARQANPLTPDPPDANAGLADRVTAIEEQPSGLHFDGAWSWSRQYTPGAVVQRGGKTWVLRGKSVSTDDVRPGEPNEWWNFDPANYPHPYPMPGGSSLLHLDPGGETALGVFPEDEQADPVEQVTGIVYTFEIEELVNLNLEIEVLAGDPAMMKGTLIGSNGAWNPLSRDAFTDQLSEGVYGKAYSIQTPGVGRYWYALYFNPALAGGHAAVDLDFRLMLGADPNADQQVKDSAWQRLTLA